MSGQELEAVTTAFPDEVFKGTIARVSPNVDPTTHTLQIRCAVDNPGLRLKPQMLARIKIVTGAGGALVVPQEALVFDTNKYYAFVEARQWTARTPRGFDRGVDAKKVLRGCCPDSSRESVWLTPNPFRSVRCGIRRMVRARS